MPVWMAQTGACRRRILKDAQEGYPEYIVCAWLGHTEAIAKEHCWQVTDDDYKRDRAPEGRCGAADSR
jgi:hypothetical protein